MWWAKLPGVLRKGQRRWGRGNTAVGLTRCKFWVGGGCGVGGRLGGGRGKKQASVCVCVRVGLCVRREGCVVWCEVCVVGAMCVGAVVWGVGMCVCGSVVYVIIRCIMCMC